MELSGRWGCNCQHCVLFRTELCDEVGTMYAMTYQEYQLMFEHRRTSSCLFLKFLLTTTQGACLGAVHWLAGAK